MTTSITFETATIADAIRRAAKVAPGKAGHAFDKAAGLLMEITPGTEGTCIIRATNLDAFHTEMIACVSTEGVSTRWRLPSQLLANTVGNLPPKSGSLVKFTQDGTKVVITQARMKATMILMDSDTYSDWDMFDGSKLTMVQGLGARVSMVEWAASPDNIPPLCGVYLDGEHAVATDRYKLARVPCKIKLDKPIIVPSGILGQCLKTMGDTGVGVSSTQLLLAPDDYTQLTTVLYDSVYPNVQPLFDMQYEEEVEVNKADFLDKLARAGQYAGADRSPLLRTFWGKGELAVMMENQEMGLIGDVVDLGGQAQHKRREIKFTPKNLIDALNHAPDAKVKIRYDSSEKETPTVYINGGSGYEAWVMKRREARPEVATE